MVLGLSREQPRESNRRDYDRETTRPWRFVVACGTGGRREQVRTERGVNQKRIFFVLIVHTHKYTRVNQ